MVAAPGTQPKMVRYGAVWETSGGPGLYWYVKEQFTNVVLRVEWRTAAQSDNSGIYLRTPPFDAPNALQAADTQGSEVQIDESGAPDGADVHRTGAIYGLQAPSAFPAKPVGKWNAFEIEANGAQLKVRLNGQDINTYQSSRQQTGYLALQVHHPGSRVQFRNLQIKKLP